MSVATQTLRPQSRTLMFMEGRAISELGAFLGALPLLSLRPRSEIRLFVMGGEVDQTMLLESATSPVMTGKSDKAARAAGVTSVSKT